MELFRAILADFTEEDWQDVKDGIKECMVNQFEEMWTQYYVWDCDKIEDMLADRTERFISEQFKELFNRADMRTLFMNQMLKQIQGGNKE